MEEKLGTFIKQLRVDRKLSLRDASKKLEIQEAYLWQLENNKRGAPRPEILNKLAAGYGVAPETLLKYAGYAVGPVDEKQEVEAKKKVLYRDYDKLSEEGKKELETLMGWLQKKHSKK